MKPTNLFSVLFFKSWQGKEKIFSLTKYGKLVANMYIHIAGNTISPLLVTCFFFTERVGFWWIPSQVCLFLSQRSVWGNDLLIWGRQIMCWAITGDVLLIWSTTLQSVSFLKQNSDMTWTFPLFLVFFHLVKQHLFLYMLISNLPEFHYYLM